MNMIAVPVVPAANGFDYRALDAGIADRVRVVADRIRRQAKDFYLSVGRDLIAVKDLLQHGQFGPWLEAEFGWSERTAQNFMNATKLVDANKRNIADLPATAIYRLASPSTPESVRDEILERVGNGERIAVKEITATIAEGRKRDAEERAEQQKLERRLRGKTPEAQVRVHKDIERRQRQQERELEKERQERAAVEAAAKAAVEILVRCLGDELPKFKELFDRAGYRFAGKLAAAIGPRP